MKKSVILISCAALMFPFCVNSSPSQEGGPAFGNFSEVEGKEWVLTEVRKTGLTVFIDRNKFAADDMGGFFTIQFRPDPNTNERMVNGVGAPNRYFGPYYTGTNKTLSFGDLASTLMMAFREPDDLKEYEYFSYLSRVSRWNLAQGKLELHCTDGNGEAAILVYSLK